MRRASPLSARAREGAVRPKGTRSWTDARKAGARRVDAVRVAPRAFLGKFLGKFSKGEKGLSPVRPGEELSGAYGDVGPGKPKGRRAGVVLHPTSLPGSYGSGELGPAAYDFVDWLESAGMQAWQVLPLVPPERMFWSPYAGQNANSGNVLLISLESLVDEELLLRDELPADVPPGSTVDFETVAKVKEPLLAIAAERLLDRTDALRSDFDQFCAKNTDWLNSAALFDCLSNSADLRGLNWWEWPADLRDRDPSAMAASKENFKSEIVEFMALQFLFDRQWIKLREYANSKQISIIGDMPIYVGGHSADVWANRSLFELNEEGKSLSVSGVPPDAFSKTGQLWGNPLYDWQAMKKDGYAWWVQRLTRAFHLYDETRIDHFRGFAGYWSVDSREETAMIGKWLAGPGEDLFKALTGALGETKIMAEDLGVITEDVVDLRETIGAPGMLVLQFGFDGNPKNPHLPHNHYENCFIYPGTHDNDTTNGWYEKIGQQERDFIKTYLGYADEDDMAWTFIKAAMASVAKTAMFTMQDVLSLDNSGRMNLPGTAEGNWAWKMKSEFSSLDGVATKLRSIAALYDREP